MAAEETKQDDKDDSTFSKVTIGTYEEGLKFVGFKSETHVADFDIEPFMAQFYAASIADANSSFWDRDYAESQWGGLTASSGLLSTVSKSMPWRPGGVAPRKNIVFNVPLPGGTVINSGSETEFYRPLRIGDRISSFDEVTAISAEKTTRLGTGHFVDVVTTYLNQNGDVIARNTNSIFRFTPAMKD